ncbi:MAG: amidohydrolase family protein [Pirellulales bacterium]|nr:amidohydrolase family protein [Pirellulales bacterium]
MIVDCHTHWADCFQSRDGLDPSRWLADEARHGVTHALVLPYLGLLDDRLLRQENDDLAAVCAASAGRMIPFCTVNPFRKVEAVAEFRRAIEVLKMRGLKIHPWLQGVSINSDAMDELCEMAGHWKMPVLFHDGTPCYSLPSQAAMLARRHPKTTMVLGHCGLFEHWREAIAAMRGAENLWGCLCGPHLAALSEIVRRCDCQRLLWGSDFGFSFADVAGYRLGLLQSLRLNDSDYERITAENPKRLLGPVFSN